MGHHRASADETIGPKRSAADDRRIGADGCAAFDQRSAELGLALDLGPWVLHIGEHAARPAKYAVFELDARIDADVVLHLATGTDPYVTTDEHVLADDAVLANDTVRENVAEMPNLGSGANFIGRVDVGALMHEHAVR